MGVRLELFQRGDAGDRAVIGLALLAFLGVASCSAWADDDASGGSETSAKNPATALELKAVTVVGNTPLPGLGVPLDQVPANVQQANANQLQQQHSMGLGDFLNQNLTGVAINEVQSNPVQPDVSYRGFTASPLLGTPEGLSVYVDGVRVNESFGDVVNWDLIPTSAIANITLMPGSNPVFGLNTLGGALQVTTKSGAQFPGTEFSADGGSFGRYSTQAQTGGRLGEFDYFLTGNWMAEDGWRVASPSKSGQLFGKLGWEDEQNDVDLSYSWANTSLNGNGLAPQSLLAQNPDAAYTIPDNTRNLANFVNLHGSHFLSDQLLIGGGVYFRTVDTRTFNGDLSDDYADDFDELISSGGRCARFPNPEQCAARVLADSTATNNFTQVAQRTWGGTLQITDTDTLLRRANQWVVGVSIDDETSDFTQSDQQAMLAADRTTAPTGPVVLNTRLGGGEIARGVFFTDTLSLNQRLHVTASARYNDVRVDLNDELGTGLSGHHRFDRINSALGVNYSVTTNTVAYAVYNEGNRAPTPIELGCSDPNSPCKLPNAFAGDPPLSQVVAKTWETGARGTVFKSARNSQSLSWSVAAYRTVNEHDIQFISSSTSGSGYFANVGETRRQGIELGLNGQWRRWHWHSGYGYLDATYRSPLNVVASGNSTADANGVIAVAPGDHIPLLPKSTAKFQIGYEFCQGCWLGLNVLGASGQYVRGNENNAHQSGVNASGVEYLGPGSIPGYWLLNANARYQFTLSQPTLGINQWEVYAKVNNVLDRHYETSGQLGQNAFNSANQFQPDPQNWTNETFVSPGAPIGVWAGLRLAFGSARGAGAHAAAHEDLDTDH